MDIFVDQEVQSLSVSYFYKRPVGEHWRAFVVSVKQEQGDGIRGQLRGQEKQT